MSERGTVEDGRSGPEIQELYVHRAVRQPAKASAAIKARSRGRAGLHAVTAARDNIGPLLILVGKGGHTFEPCLLPNGSKKPSSSGWPQPEFRPKDCSDVSVGQANSGCRRNGTSSLACWIRSNSFWGTFGCRQRNATSAASSGYVEP